MERQWAARDWFQNHLSLRSEQYPTNAWPTFRRIEGYPIQDQQAHSKHPDADPLRNDRLVFALGASHALQGKVAESNVAFPLAATW